MMMMTIMSIMIVTSTHPPTAELTMAVRLSPESGLEQNIQLMGVLMSNVISWIYITSL